MQLLVIDINQYDPGLNLDTENKLLRISDEYYVIRFWQNSSSVFLGKFQNHQYETNLDFLQKNNIPFFYRFTGGGTVYHDLGTLNITFSKPRLSSGSGSFSKRDSHLVTEAIVNSFSMPGFDFHISQRNAVYFGKRKLLGSAVALTKTKFLYHASLLLNTNLDDLKHCINWNPPYPDSDQKIVHSKHDDVINLTELYPISQEEIKEQFVFQVREIFSPKNTLRISKESQLEYFLSA